MSEGDAPVVKMNPEIKAKWVSLLRSGKYDQYSGQLGADPIGGSWDVDKPSRCCLGVLCELAVEDGVVEKHVSEYGYVSYRAHGDSDRFYLPKVVREWAGFGPDNYTPSVPNEYLDRDKAPHNEFGTVQLAVLNDQPGFTFDQIADIIEEHL